MAGYDTAAYCRAGYMPGLRLSREGKAEFTLTTEDDRDAMTLINKWYSEDLIDKNWAQWEDTTGGMMTHFENNEYGIIPENPFDVAGSEARINDPDARIEPLPHTLKYEGQELVYGQQLSHFQYGSTSVSAKCSNIPLMVTWMDWHYSEEGFFLGSYGVEGHLHYIDENGNPMLTDFVMNNPDGISSAWLLIMHAASALVDGCLKGSLSRFAYPGGERNIEFRMTWYLPDYKGTMDYPASVSLSDEESEELNQYTNEISTYVAENYLAFVDGSKPLSEWDAYVAELEALGLNECERIYQEAYERFMDSIAFAA